ncbi:MAG: trypsin-like peptidase domain-containing protein [Opitutaceae bacterium]|nr:trypsin-like peptidase domain-containing protein [Opitutaceae bacterium]
MDLFAIVALVTPIAVGIRAQTSEAGAAQAGPATARQVENSVVKVFATMRYPDFGRPWTKQSPTEVTASGVVIEGKRILTNAHAVLYASQVQVQANQAGDKISATVAAIAPGIDLAVLTLDDESFFDAHPPLTRANTLPAIKDPVMAYGYPTGGSSLSITKGIVSRIEFTVYNFPVSGLRIQIDAAINPGNSGGPAVAGDKMIGLAFSRLGGGTENIGYIIPCEEIELFLRDIADGRYDGKPAMFDELQTLENPALRAFLKLGKRVEGTVVHKPFRDDSAYPLKEWDLITKIGDTPVDDQGMSKLSDNIRVHFTYLIQRLAQDGKVPLTIVRAGRELAIELPVSPDRPSVVKDLQGAYPAYLIYGPLVFSPVSRQFLGLFGNNATLLGWLGTAGSPLITRSGDKPAFLDEELVVVSSPFFPHKLAQGYSNPAGKVVKAVNGIAIKNLRHLVEVLRDSRDEFIAVEFHGRMAESPVFSRQEMIAATEEILTDNGIRSQGSPDALAVWNARPAR